MRLAQGRLADPNCPFRECSATLTDLLQRNLSGLSPSYGNIGTRVFLGLRCTTMETLPPRTLPECQTTNMPSWSGLRWYLKCNGTVVDIPKSQADTPLTVTHI